MAEEPKEVTREEVFNYLTELRDSGDINMFGAADFLEEEFGLTRLRAKQWLFEWMMTFTKTRDIL